jgi:(2Fe-2S) ferredoxin
VTCVGHAKKKKLLVCVKGKSCQTKGALELYKAFKENVKNCALKGKLKLTKCGCLGLCQFAPAATVKPDGADYGRITPSDTLRIVQRHAKKKKPIKKLLVGKKNKKD